MQHFEFCFFCVCWGGGGYAKILAMQGNYISYIPVGDLFIVPSYHVNQKNSIYSSHYLVPDPKGHVCIAICAKHKITNSHVGIYLLSRYHQTTITVTYTHHARRVNREKCIKLTENRNCFGIFSGIIILFLLVC